MSLGKPSPAVLTHGRRKTRSELSLPAGEIAAGVATSGKPPYRVPSMAEIAAIPWNGFAAASTFSGCGGSSLGYKMAGFKVIWASEFVPAAQDTYRANHPGTLLDTRDVRKVSAGDVLAALGMEAGQLDLLDGSPPCASFSTAGKREAGWGKVKAYSDTRQRTDDLFFEFARLLKGLQPKVFVAENVSGLVKGTAKGYFLEILAALKACGYAVEARLLDAQWLGVPQMRQRVIFVGVRDDLGLKPCFPKPLPYRYSVREALGGIGLRPKSYSANEWSDADGPAAAVQASGQYWIEEQRGFDGHRFVSGDQPMPTVAASRPVRDADGAEASMEGYAVGEEWKRLVPGKKSAKYQSLVRPSPSAPSPTVTAKGGDVTAASVTHPSECRKFTIAELRRVCAFPDDFVLTGTYAQQWERLGRAVPPVMMFHIARAVRDGVLCRLPR